MEQHPYIILATRLIANYMIWKLTWGVWDYEWRMAMAASSNTAIITM